MTAWIVQNMAAASVMMIVVLVLRTPVARAFGAVWAYALWLLPLARLLLPPMPQLTPELPLPALAILLPAAAAAEAGGAVPAQGAAWGWTPVLLGLWLAGAAIFLGAQFFSYRSFLARLSLASRSAGAYRGLPVIESEAVDGPIAVGLLDRRIVVPLDFTHRYSETERRLAAEHEFVHHRRGDIWWNLAALLVLALNWFNPIAWIAFVAFRADQELACDAAVALGAEAGERLDYAQALVKSASRPGLIHACPLNHADQLKRRLKMMKSHRTGRLRSIGGAAAFVTLAGAGLALAAPGAAHPHEEGKEGERRIVIMEMKDGARGPDGARARHAPGDRVMVRRGPNGAPVMPERCERGERLVEVNEEGGDQRTHIFLCSTDTDPAARLRQLETLRERMASGDLHGEHRERVLAAVDRAIAQLRAGL